VDSDEWDEEEGEEMDTEAKAFPLTKCFFCGIKSKTLSLNMGHMERTHSFYFPHKHACDLETFYAYLGEKVGF